VCFGVDFDFVLDMVVCVILCVLGYCVSGVFLDWMNSESCGVVNLVVVFWCESRSGLSVFCCCLILGWW